MSTLVTVHHSGNSSVAVDREALTEFTDALLNETGRAEFGLAVVLTDDAEISELNTTYRHRTGATNVLSFPFADGGQPVLEELPIRELGDIIISVDTVLREAREYGQPFTFRLCRLVVHGLLHLLGMDHERSAEEERLMQARENELLQRVPPARFGL